MKKTIAKIMLLAVLAAPMAAALPMEAGAVAIWVTTNPATSITSSDATLNGTNGNGSKSGHYFWVSTSPFVTTSATLPAGVYATPDLGTLAPNVTFSAQLSSAVGMPAVTSNTTYYFAAWASTNGTAQAGDVLSFTTALPETTSTVKVTILKYIDSSVATAASANSATFTMNSTWTAQNIGSGSGVVSLSATSSPSAYEAVSADMTLGASYSTSEAMDSSLVGSACAQTPGQAPTFAFVGYTTGDTLIDAQQATSTSTAPAFTNMTSDKFVIVHNTLCPTGSTGSGNLDGNVTTDAALHVDSITVDKGSSSADGTFAGGWKYTFHITTPNAEPNLAMKFADWLSGANVIPVANNMRISSAQATVTTPVLLTAANIYSTSALHMTADLDSVALGRQVDVVVEVSVPVGTVAGSYSTTYGVQTTP